LYSGLPLHLDGDHQVTAATAGWWVTLTAQPSAARATRQGVQSGLARHLLFVDGANSNHWTVPVIQHLIGLLMVLVLLGALRQPLLGSVQQASRSLVAALLGGPSGRWQQPPRPVLLAAPYGETPARVQLAFAPNPHPNIETAPRNPPSTTPRIEPERPARPPRLNPRGPGRFFFLPPLPENDLEELVPGQ
jgi:hypothetical protein